jgi:hypothetical protein
MRNRQLHFALLAFAEEAAWQLASDTAAGHEVPFEVVEARGARRDRPLYCYRPLTADFIDQRQSVIARLPTYLPAVHALSAVGGLEAYLQARVSRGGVSGMRPRERAELALRALLGQVFEDSSDFALVPARFEQAYADLEAIVHEGRTETLVVAPLLGLQLESAEVAMGDGLALMRGDALDDAPADAVWPRGGGTPHVLAVLRWEAAAGDEAPLEHARIRLGRLVTALRLYDPAGVGLGPAAWTRTAGGPWQVVVLGPGAALGRPRAACPVTPAQEDELRAFCSLVGRRTPRGGEVAWALRRFELGCTRERPEDGLTDHLLALRALLEPEGPASGRLAGRLAAVCAEPDDRDALAERVRLAVAAERSVVTGAGLPPAEVVAALAGDVESHARAILRDVLCGHLDADVRAVADALLQPAEAPQGMPAEAPVRF